jgi:glycosyltransferase involved in cell wall biosynthesis
MKKTLVIIPSYNTGPALATTVGEVFRHWKGPVWVVIDGSDDGSDAILEGAFGSNDHLRILRRQHNSGKGASVLLAADRALGENFTHACVFDSDGQHCAADIERMLTLSDENGSTFTAGVPVFGSEAPVERVKGRRVGNTFARIETLGRGPLDSLYGMRVYPLKALVRVMSASFGGKRYDFDTEASVRLTWSGIRPIDFKTPVKYLTKEQGGVSHFKYLRDNVLLTAMHIRLLSQMIFRIPKLIACARRWKREASLRQPV